MICHSCGVAVDDGVVFCPNCGADLAAAPTQTYAQPTAQSAPVYTQQPQAYGAVPGQPVAPAQTAAPGVYTGKGTPSLVLGILSIVFAGLIGLVLSIIAIVKGKNALALDPNDGRAKAGRITGIVGLVLSLIGTILGIALTVWALMMTGNPDVQEAVNQAVVEASQTSSEQTAATGASAGAVPSSSLEATDASTASSAPTAEPLDTWAEECLDANNNPTVYSILELKGFQLETLLQQLGWKYDSFEQAWMGSDGAGVAVLDAEGKALNDFEIGDLDKGGAGTPAVYFLVQPGYSNVNDALANSKVVNEDTFVLDDAQAMAVVYGPSMNEQLGILTIEDGNANWILFNKEAVEAGAVQTLAGDVEGRTIDAIWQELTGGAVGAE